MIMPIRILGDPVLREPAKPVTTFDRTLRTLRDDMLETMYDAPGVGLAGPQVGISLRVFTFDDGQTGPSFMTNPVLSGGRGSSSRRRGASRSPARTTRRSGTRGSRAAATTWTVSPSSSRGRVCWLASSSTRPTISMACCSSIASTTTVGDRSWPSFDASSWGSRIRRRSGA